MSNIGRFLIAEDTYNSWSLEDTSNYLGTNFKVYKIDYNVFTRKYEFWAQSSLFADVSDSAEIPLYNLNFTTETVTPVAVPVKKYLVTHASSTSNTAANTVTSNT
jgi:hypothetical protein